MADGAATAAGGVTAAAAPAAGGALASPGRGRNVPPDASKVPGSGRSPCCCPATSCAVAAKRAATKVRVVKCIVSSGSKSESGSGSREWKLRPGQAGVFKRAFDAQLRLVVKRVAITITLTCSHEEKRRSERGVERERKPNRINPRGEKTERDGRKRKERQAEQTQAWATSHIWRQNGVARDPRHTQCDGRRHFTDRHLAAAVDGASNYLGRLQKAGADGVPRREAGRRLKTLIRSWDHERRKQNPASEPLRGQL